ncbi:MAG: RNA methyltransferase [Acidimicrobiia bacterium]|nr:RNA methyltransferase [Acidimicrobiia bacterium]
MKSISSRQHPLVKAFRALAADSDPKGARLLLDGVHQVRDAIAAGVALDTIAVAASRLSDDSEEGRVAREAERFGTKVVSVTAAALSAVSPVRSPSGIVAIATREPVTAAAVCGIDNGFVVAAVDVQDPGNVGSLIRAAEAGGASGVLVCGASANPFSWKALRGSMGSALRFPVVHGLSAHDALGCAKRFGARTVAAVPACGKNPDDIDWTGRVVLMLGGEGGGLDASTIAHCEERVTIPMAAPVESLNVAVAGGILVYAARRQRT